MFPSGRIAIVGAFKNTQRGHILGKARSLDWYSTNTHYYCRITGIYIIMDLTLLGHCGTKLLFVAFTKHRNPTLSACPPVSCLVSPGKYLIYFTWEIRYRARPCRCCRCSCLFLLLVALACCYRLLLLLRWRILLWFLFCCWCWYYLSSITVSPTNDQRPTTLSGHPLYKLRITSFIYWSGSCVLS